MNLFSNDIRIDKGLEPVLWNWSFGAVKIFTGELFSSQDVVDTFEVLIGKIVSS
jgi:hypothetical protein